MTPATLALMTAVGPPDWATNKFPTSSAIVFKRFFRGRPAFDGARCPTSDQIEATPCQPKIRLSKGNTAGDRRKLQIPSSKHQRNPKLQTSNHRADRCGIAFGA